MKNVVKTDQAPGAIGPYSQGIQVGDIRKPRIIIFKCC